MKRQNKSEIIICENKPKWYELMIAFVFYSLTVYFIYYLSNLYNLYATNRLSSLDFNSLVLPFSSLIIFLFFMAINLSYKQNIIINTRSNVLISRYIIWGLKYDSRKRATNSEYISYFKDDQNYGVNLWYKGNKHFEIGYFDDLTSAQNAAYEIARTLKIDLLDATEKGNQKWIDVESQ